jgi:hypothetical protein
VQPTKASFMLPTLASEPECAILPKQGLTNIFTQEEGVVNIGGIDALVRLTPDQTRMDGPSWAR